jgi:hypothetical protein
VINFTLLPLYLYTHWTGGWVDPRAGLEAVVRRKNPIMPVAGTSNPVVQPVA